MFCGIWFPSPLYGSDGFFVSVKVEAIGTPWGLVPR